MKSGLKRIEATLDRLHPQIDGEEASAAFKAPPHPVKPPAKTIQPFPIPKESPIAAPASLPPLNHPSPNRQPQAIQAQAIQSQPAQPHLIQPHLIQPQLGQPQLGQPQPAQPHQSSASQPSPVVRASRPIAKPRRVAARPTATPETFSHYNPEPQPLALPKSKPPSFSKHRHAVNPDLAVGLLKEVETVVVNWQLSLEQTVLEIQALYLDGPIVDGWLESHPYGSPQVMQPIGTATLRHAEIDRLIDYVEEICRVSPSPETGEIPRTGYRLCGLDADGQLWSRPCPAQQVPYVSLAIARYQKLRILLAKKQALENRLNQLIQNLTLLHGQIQEPLS